MMVNWLLIVVAVILIWNMVSGYRKGLVHVLYRFVSSILSIVLSLFLVSLLGETIRTSTPFYGVIESWAQQAIDSLETGNAILDLLLSQETLGTEIAQELSLAVFNIILFLILSVIVRILLLLIGILLDRVSDVPVLGTLNRLLGFIAGIAHGMLIVWMLFVLFELIGTTSFGSSALQCIERNSFLQAIADHNLLFKILAAFLI